MFVAALDLGTTGCRTYIFDLTGTISWNPIHTFIMPITYLFYINL